GCDAQQLPRLRRELDLFRGARKYPAAGRDLRPLVVAPARPRQVEQALALGKARLGVRVRIEKDVAVIERGDEPDGALEQHAVAEHVARHVADARARELRRADVDVDLAEMPAHRLPGAARRDAHFLVVIAGRAARRERIAEPELALDRN